MPISPKRFESIQYGASYAAVHPDTIRREIQRGNLVAYRLGRVIRIDLNELDQLLSPLAHAKAGDSNV